MEAAHARLKSYVDQWRRPLEFEVGDFVYLKVSPIKGVNHFSVKRKLAPRYVGPYQIIQKNVKVAYKVRLPYEMRAIFPVFHVSQLKKCLRIPEERVETRGIKLQSIKLYRVLWNNQSERDATWESEDYLQATYPSFYEK